ncbi:MAG: AsmA-like C-terminal domain-containing protein [Chloroflexota bacterium]
MKRLRKGHKHGNEVRINVNKRRRRIIIVAVGTLIALLIALVVVAPHLIDTEAIRGAIAKEVSKRIAGKVEIGRITVSFIPLPHATLHDVNVSIPETLSGAVGDLRIEPRISALLTGTVRIGGISIVRPNVRVFGHRKTDAPTRAVTEDKVSSILSGIASMFPDGSVRVENGTLEFAPPDASPILFSNIDIDVRFPRDSISLTLACRSTFAEHLSLSGEINARDLKGDWHFEARDLRPQTLAARLYPAAGEHIGDSSVSMDIRLKHQGFGIFDAEFDGSAPTLTISRRGERLVFVVNKLGGQVHHSKEKTELSIEKLALASPRLILSSKFTIDRQTPHAVLEIQGSEIDAAALRKTSLALGGDIPLVQTVFSYVQAGTIPRITFWTDGRTAADLGATRNIIIKGQVRDGTIGIPGPKLVVKRVDGDVTISEGILKGERLRGRMGGIESRDGRLSVGIKGADAPFHLDVLADAQFRDLLPLLKRFIKNSSVVEELSRVRTIEGRARGRLILGESLQSMFARTDITSLRVSASYEPIPYPVKISGGKFLYDERSAVISVADLSGSVGRSTFSDLAADLDMKKDARFAIHSMKSSLVVDELYSWLTSYESLREDLKSLTALRGLVHVSALTVEGALHQPKQWRFEGKGEIEKLHLEGKDIPRPLDVGRGAFAINHERLSVTDLPVRVLDASLDMTGSLEGYFGKSPEAEVTLAGRLGADATRYISDMISPRQGIGLKGPITLSDVHVGWAHNGLSSVKGRYVFDSGPVVILDLSRHTGKISIPTLEIKDGGTKAFLSFQPGEKEFQLRFTGELNEATIGKIITGFESPACCIRGDFDARINLAHPSGSAIHGTVEAKNIQVPTSTTDPLMIENLSLTAEGNVLRIGDAALSLSDNRLSLRGDATFSEKSIVLEMDLTASKLQVERIRDLARSFQAEKKTPASWSPAIKGKMRVKLGSLVFGDFTWEPFNGDVSFDGDHLDVTVTDARLCGIASPGSVTITGDFIEFSTTLTATGENVRSTVQCLTDKRDDLIGTYDLKADLHAKGTVDSLYRSLSGNVEFTAKKGFIYRNPTLSNIFALLNVSEIFRGKFPKFGQKGLRYNSLSGHGKIKDGRLTWQEVVVDGPTIHITGQGNIDLVDRSLNLTALVAPFKTTDSIIRHIPIIGYVLGHGLVVVPVAINGSFDDPRVQIISASAVGTELTGIMKRTLLLPFHLIDALAPVSGDSGAKGQSTSKP